METQVQPSHPSLLHSALHDLTTGSFFRSTVAHVEARGLQQCMCAVCVPCLKSSFSDTACTAPYVPTCGNLAFWIACLLNLLAA